MLSSLADRILSINVCGLDSICSMVDVLGDRLHTKWESQED